jgi:hypothetical protein
MKALMFIAALLAANAASIRADSSSSENYTIAAQTIDGGGGATASADYAQDIGTGDFAGRSIALASDVMTYGFISLLNNAPVAGDDLRSHPLDQSVTLSGASLLANDLDPEGDTLRIFKWDGTTARGGHVSLIGSDLRYDPPAALRDDDHFSYTVIDSNGDTATAVVTMVIAPADTNQSINTVAAYGLANGKILLRFKQTPGAKEYRIEFKPDLHAPIWQLVTSSKSPDGIIEIEIDPSQSEQGYFHAAAVF